MSDTSAKSTYECVDLAALRKNQRNARKHPAKQIALLRKSIEQFGFLAPVVVGEDDIILAGHARVEAARLAGIRTVPIVRVSHLNADQQAAYMLADNRLAELSTWDKTRLKNELILLNQPKVSFDFQAIGFGAQKGTSPVRRARSTATSMDREETDAGIWFLDQHRIYCGVPDNRTVNQILDGTPAKVIIAEIKLQQRERTDSDTDSLLQLYAARHTEKDALIYVGCRSWELSSTLNALKSSTRLLQTCVLPTKIPLEGPFYTSNHMLVAVFARPKWAASSIEKSDVWSLETNGEINANSSFSVQTIQNILTDSTSEGDSVFVPFGNAKAHLVAAAKTSRKARIVESDRSILHDAIEWWERSYRKQALFLSAREMRKRKSTEILGAR